MHSKTHQITPFNKNSVGGGHALEPLANTWLFHAPSKYPHFSKKKIEPPPPPKRNPRYATVCDSMHGDRTTSEM